MAAVRHMPPVQTSADPHDVGTRVLAGFAKGRDRINGARKRAAQATTEIVRLMAEQDAKSGFPERGRAGRIAKKLKRHGIGASTVYRHFLKLYSVRIDS